MVFRMELTYDEFNDMLDINCIAGSTNGYIIPPGLYEISDLKFMLNSSLPNEVKVTFQLMISD